MSRMIELPEPVLVALVARILDKEKPAHPVVQLDDATVSRWASEWMIGDCWGNSEGDWTFLLTERGTRGDRLDMDYQEAGDDWRDPRKPEYVPSLLDDGVES